MRMRARGRLVLGLLFLVVAPMWAALAVRGPTNLHIQRAQAEMTGARSSRAARANGPNAAACGVWSIFPAAGVGATRSTLNSVTALGANDVWAVGAYTSPATSTFQNLAEHFAGSTWSAVFPPNQGTGRNTLTGVRGLAFNDIWAVGNYRSGRLFQTLAEHYNGTSWSIVPSQNVGSYSSALASVAPVAANDAWAVGAFSNTVANQTLIERYGGSMWTVYASPNAPGSADNQLASVRAVSPTDVWAVGSYSGTMQAALRTLVEHYNGASWVVFPSPNVGTGDNDLNGLAVATATDIWAVGSYSDTAAGALRTLVERFDGAAWQVFPSVNAATGADNLLSSAAVVAADDVWAVGYYSDTTKGAFQTLVEHFDGASWRVVPSPNQGAGDNALHSIAAVSAADIWAVGSYSDTTTMQEQTLIEHWMGGPCPPPAPLYLPDLEQGG